MVIPFLIIATLINVHARGTSNDVDDDNDGWDDEDSFAEYQEWLDTDGDGVGNNADPDDDGDGQSDADEASCGSDPLSKIQCH